jgi:hypothetical protein
MNKYLMDGKLYSRNEAKGGSGMKRVSIPFLITERKVLS